MISAEFALACLAAMAVLLLPGFAVASLLAPRWRSQLREGRPAIEWRAPLIAVASGLTTVVVFMSDIWNEPLPIYDDPAVHAAYAEAIKRSPRCLGGPRPTRKPLRGRAPTNGH